MRKLNEFKWHKVNEAAAKKLTFATNSPGVVYPINNAMLPEQIKTMTGVSSYYVSGYTSLEIGSSNHLIEIVGEMVVARTDENLTKNYNYAFGVSSDGEVYFSGPYKGFGHHVSSGHNVEVSSLFGQTPYGK
jgi:hypothetical protein